jgi:lactoylglutathione lyase
LVAPNPEDVPVLDTIAQGDAETPAMDDATESSPILRIAVATRDGQRIDLHFGHAESFTVFDVDPDGPRLVETRQVADHLRDENEDKRDAIYRMVADCKILLVAKIGAAPQEALSAIGIESTNMYAGKNVDSALRQLYAAKIAAAGNAAIDTSEFTMLHAMFRVADLDRSIGFYTEKLGMTVLERREHKKNQFSQAYLGYGAGYSGMTLELVANWQREATYVAGDAFGHIAIGVKNIMGLCDRLAAAGVPMPRPPRAQRHGENIVAFVEDPDGYRIELVQVPLPSEATALEEALQP